MRALVRDAIFVDQEFGVAGLHGLGDAGEDRAGEGVGPVVEDGVEVVGACSWRGEVVS